MIYADGNVFLLQTRNTTYMFRRTDSGHLEHLHFGGSLFSEQDYDRMKDEIDLETDDKELIDKLAHAIAPKHAFGGGNMNYYSDEHQNTCLELLGLEFSSFGKGDIREPMVEIVYPDGSTTVDFLFYDYEFGKGKRALEALPSSYDDTDTAEQLIIKLTDKEYSTRLELIYTVFPDCDVITRSAVLANDGEKEINPKLKDLVKRLNTLGVEVDIQEEGVQNQQN